MNTKLTIVLTFLLVTSLTAQRYAEVVLWKAKTTNEGVLVGLAHSQSEIQELLQEYQSRNHRKKYSLRSNSLYIKHKTMLRKKDSHPVSEFQKQAENSYLFLSWDDQETLDIIAVQGFEKGIQSYMERKSYSKEFTKNRFRKLWQVYDQFDLDALEEQAMFVKL